MPYKLRKAPKRDLYWVIAQDGKHMSKDPIPKERAEAQRKALYASERRQEEAKIPTAREEKQIEKKMEGGSTDDDIAKIQRAIDGLKQQQQSKTISKRDRDANAHHIANLEKILDALKEGEAVETLKEMEGANALLSLRRGTGHHHTLHGGGPVLDVVKKYIHPIIATLMAAGMAGYAGWEESHNQYLKTRGSSPEGGIAFASLLGALGTIGTYGTIYAILTARGVPQRPARVIAHAAEDESGIEMVENPTHELQRQPSHQAVAIPPTPVRGSGPLPELSILQQIAKAAYSTSPPQTIGPFKLRSFTPTLKFYVLPDPDDQRHIDTLVVGIRGTNTSDKQDLYADAKLGLGQLEDTPRWKKDLADFNAVMSRLRDPQSVDVYGVGHSLGGAVLDMFLKKGLIRQGVSYNPAISMGDAQKDIPNRRIYQDGDPLLAIMGRSAKNVEVRPKKVKEQSVGRKIANAFSYFIPYVGLVTKGMDTLDAHALDNFTGGASPAYLRQAKAKAKAYGLDPKKLKVATDGKHKLSYDGVLFGAMRYGDHLLWSAEEKAGRVPKGTAEKKRKQYRARAEKIKGEWKANKTSPNNLAIHILW